jgi:hypothetical protein
MLPSICFVTCHIGSAAHFAAFAEILNQEFEISVLATGPSLKKFEERQIQAADFNPSALDLRLEENRLQLAREVAKTCSSARIIISDVGDAFSIDLNQSLSVLKTGSAFVHLTYYDNPEAFVPGGYSETAARVMRLSSGVLFANANLASETIYREDHGKAPIEFNKIRRMGIGYYPLENVEKIRKKRTENRAQIRSDLFGKLGLTDQQQKVLVYFGGNNEVYFNNAFPTFLDMIDQASIDRDFSNQIILIQQHPAAKAKKIEQGWIEKHSFDRNPRAPRVFISSFDSDTAQAVADAAVYYQISMAPQFILAGLPVIQAGHETYPDILIRNRLARSATDGTSFLAAWDDILASTAHSETEAEARESRIWQGLGMERNWQGNLLRHLQNCLDKSEPF